MLPVHGGYQHTHRAKDGAREWLAWRAQRLRDARGCLRPAWFLPSEPAADAAGFQSTGRADKRDQGSNNSMCVDHWCLSITTTVTDDCTGAVERTVKARVERDVRRLHVSWSRTASNEEILPALVQVIHGLHLSVCVPVMKVRKARLHDR